MVNVHLQLIDDGLALHHLIRDFGTEFSEGINGMAQLGFDQAAHFHDLGRNAVQFGIELA